MALTQEQINKSAIMAAVMVKDMTIDKLQALSAQLQSEALRESFAINLKNQLDVGSDNVRGDLTLEFFSDITERLRYNVEQRLKP